MDLVCVRKANLHKQLQVETAQNARIVDQWL